MPERNTATEIHKLFTGGLIFRTVIPSIYTHKKPAYIDNFHTESETALCKCTHMHA